jgi:hypothetical protein
MRDTLNLYLWHTETREENRKEFLYRRRIKQVTNSAEEVIMKRAGVLRQIDYGGKKNDKLEKS